LFNGRRIDLDALASQARELWHTRASLVPRSATLEWLSRAVILALFTVTIIAHDALSRFRWHELPAVLLPFAVVMLAGYWLRRMNVHITLTHMPQVALPFEAAPLLHRLHLNATAWLSRMQALLMALPLPHLYLDEREAVQSIMLFAQRMSHNWLELRAFIEAALERAFAIAEAVVDWIASPLQPLLRAIAGLTRAPQVIALRC
jgi:hypothetical protein